MGTPTLIGVDWGTSSFRAYLIDGSGTAIDRRADQNGILGVAGGRFFDVLAAATADWRRLHGPLPIIMSGMIGSRQGWREAAYAACPAGLADLAAGLLRFDAESLGEIAIVPGLSTERGGVPDVMRGEETQIVGALATAKAGESTFVLPGTHSKWVKLAGGRIISFSTYMTGEAFSALKDHTILGRLMQPSMTGNAEAFRAGVAAGAAEGRPGGLLNRIFAARTLPLFARLEGQRIADYLSGVLIGAEIADAARGGSITIIGADTLVDRYAAAAGMLGLSVARARADCVVTGHFAIARAAGLIKVLP